VTRRLLASVLLTCFACFGMLGLVIGLGWSPKLGLDLEGGLSVIYQPVRSVSTSELQTVVNIMTNRANALGVAQPSITTQSGIGGRNDVVVALPGVKDPQRVLSTIGTTAQLFFRPVLCGAPPYTPSKAATPTGSAKPASQPYRVPPTCSGPYRYTSAYYSGNGNYQPPPQYLEDPALATYRSTPPSQDQQYEHANVLFQAPAGVGAARYLLGPAEATGTIIKTAFPQLGTNGQWTVIMDLTSKGSAIFNQIAAKNYHQLVANDLDGRIVSAPVLLSSSYNGSAQISGNFNEATASKLATELSYGAFPVSLKPLTSTTVSPSLGKASLDAGLAAGLLGLLLVMIYTIVYYRALGIVVVAGLVTTAAFLYGLITVLGNTSTGLTLDLSGVTGLIVSVGITVDSYVVYFERLKDEVRAGRSVRASVDKGFKSAYRTILSADAVSLIGAVVLWLLSVGNVRGFAFMLGLSTLVDVVTAYVFTRPLVILLGRNRIFTEARHLGVARGLAVSSAQVPS
jgi:preprotein translocase subunit SecD